MDRSRFNKPYSSGEEKNIIIPIFLVLNKSRTTSKQVQASFLSVHVKVYGRAPKRKPPLTKKTTKAHLTFNNF